MASLFKFRYVSNLKAMIWEDKKWTERKNIIPKKLRSKTIMNIYRDIRFNLTTGPSTQCQNTNVPKRNRRFLVAHIKNLRIASLS